MNTTKIHVYVRQFQFRVKSRSNQMKKKNWDFGISSGVQRKSRSGRELDPISLILIPGETMWVPIKSSKSGRIFALVFSSNERYFFWLQEKNSGNLSLNELSTKDKEIYNKMIGVLNNSSESDEEESNDEKQKAQDVDVSMQD